MRTVDKPATIKNPPERFTGDVWLDLLATPQEGDQRMTVGLVRFAPGSRTAWHRHARGQTLHVRSGVALVQSRGAAVVEVRPGQTVYCPPGEEHWHGATRDDFMEHLAMSEGADDPADSTVWLGSGTSPTRSTTPADTAHTPGHGPASWPVRPPAHSRHRAAPAGGGPDFSGWWRAGHGAPGRCSGSA